jgi:hypothetical protein
MDYALKTTKELVEIIGQATREIANRANSTTAIGVSHSWVAAVWEVFPGSSQKQNEKLISLVSQAAKSKSILLKDAARLTRKQIMAVRGFGIIQYSRLNKVLKHFGYAEINLSGKD